MKLHEFKTTDGHEVWVNPDHVAAVINLGNGMSRILVAAPDSQVDERPTKDGQLVAVRPSSLMFTVNTDARLVVAELRGIELTTDGVI